MARETHCSSQVKPIRLRPDSGAATGLISVKKEDISIERYADVSEELSHNIQPILYMYNAAIHTAISRLDILQDEFAFRKQRSPVHHIDSRLKSAKSILGKMKKKGLPLTLYEACNNIFDIAGIRVVCPYRKDIYLVRDRILANDDIQLVEMKDYIEEPKSNGYQSLHMIIQLPVYFMDKKQMVPVEVQLRTLGMDLWASLEHDIRYKSNEEQQSDIARELLKCSELIYLAERKMESIRFTAED